MYVTLEWVRLSDFDRTITARVIDATGKIVHLDSVKYDLRGTAEDFITFPVRLAKGVYTIEMVHNNEYIYMRLVVQ